MPAIRTQHAALQQEARDALFRDITILKIDVNLEEAQSSLTAVGKAVLLGHLVENDMDRAMFLGLRNSPLRRRTWIEEELERKFPGMKEVFYENDNDFIVVKVVDTTPDNREAVVFKVKKTTQFSKLMDAYNEREGKIASSVRFLYEGSRIQPTDTPDLVSLCPTDVLNCYPCDSYDRDHPLAQS